MNPKNTQHPNTLYIHGIGIYTDVCQDKDSFLHFLVTGKHDSISSVLDKRIGKGSKLKEQEVIQNLALCLKDLLKEAQQMTSEIDVSSLEIFIHNPFSKEGRNLQSVFNQESSTFSKITGLNSSKCTFLNDTFGKTIEQVFLKIYASKLSACIFLSPFTYFTKNSVDNLFAGAGALLLSREKIKANAPQISLLGNNSVEANPEITESLRLKDDCIELKNFVAAPIIQIIGSILEIEEKSKFPVLESNFSSENQEGTSKSEKFIRPWFLHKYESSRKKFLKMDGKSFLEIIDTQDNSKRASNSFRSFDYYILPLAFSKKEDVAAVVNQYISLFTKSSTPERIISSAINEYASNPGKQFTLCVLGKSCEELITELERAHTGVIQALDSQKDWRTPAGSFFTSKPLGKEAKISFVYPGAFNTYIGMGSELFFLFPDLYKQLTLISEDPTKSINAKVIFPYDTSADNMEELQKKILHNPIQMISSGVCFSFLFTKILIDYFDVNPSFTFGYSLGENSMMFATGIWTQADAMRTSLEVSPMFRNRVSGEQLAIREFWKLPPTEQDGEMTSIWANYVVMASKDKVESAIDDKNKVFITHINTDRQVVIGGEKDACEKVIDKLKCMHLQAPYNHAIHCAPIASEYAMIHHLHDWPVENNPTIPVFSAADYEPLDMDSEVIAKSFAKMLTNPIDFPRLVERAYQDGARVFLELGAGSNCSKWISANLKNKPHLSASINQVNVSDHVSILRLLAQLISHKIPVNLSYLLGVLDD